MKEGRKGGRKMEEGRNRSRGSRGRLSLAAPPRKSCACIVVFWWWACHTPSLFVFLLVGKEGRTWFSNFNVAPSDEGGKEVCKVKEGKKSRLAEKETGNTGKRKKH
jgi:hypothetical protein